MIFRCYTEKRTGFDIEAQMQHGELREVLGMSEKTALRIFNRYDIEDISAETYEKAREFVFSEPQTDICYDEHLPELPGVWLLAVEALPGQFDQRADSCAQCVQILAGGDRPLVASAKLYAFSGELSEAEKNKIEDYLINRIESRRAALEKPKTLRSETANPRPSTVIKGFISAADDDLLRLIEQAGLAMDLDDLRFMRDWFQSREGRDPNDTELKVIDTYWSDHCRHTTFNSFLDLIEIADNDVSEAYEKYLDARAEVYGEAARTRPQTLMDLATIGAKLLKKRGLLTALDESEEQNACSIRVEADINGKKRPFLLMFKNETHNHPTEIEPFGGAATCIGGAIRDPLAGRAYVYQAMRVTGAGDPRLPLSETVPGKLSQRKLTTTAAAGYSSYGNQIGVPTGLVHEFYHPGYVAKRMEVGAVIGAAPAENVVRQTPECGDVVILVGGRTGRDGIGGATGSSKVHNKDSIREMKSEVQKGNAPEERKIQRLFRDSDTAKLIKRCNDFGAGGVAVAIGELADGLDIDLDLVRKKYEGLSGTELAISESQERMAVVVSAENAERFIKAAERENLEAYVVAAVTDSARMVMRHAGEIICDLSREFLSSSGAIRHREAYVPRLPKYLRELPSGTPIQKLEAMLSELRFCSQRGLSERFDGTVGANTALFPFGGKTERSPAQVMAALIPENGAKTCSVMSFGFDPYHSSENCFTAAYDAVISSVTKLVASGCDPAKVYLSFQEYFERLGADRRRWGKPLAALLGAFRAQIELGCAAIGGKDSMSGSFLNMDVPPTLISFAVAPSDASALISPEFKKPDSYVYLITGGGDISKTKKLWTLFTELASGGGVLSARALTAGGIAEAVFLLSLGNNIGFEAAGTVGPEMFFNLEAGDIVFESEKQIPWATQIGVTLTEPVIRMMGEERGVDEMYNVYKSPLERIFPTSAGSSEPVSQITYNGAPLIEKKRSSLIRAAIKKTAAPRAVIPVFPGTNCELETANALERAGGVAQIVVIRNQSPAALSDSVIELVREIERSQMIILPGGFSGGDEPDGSGKFIAAFFRNNRLTDAVHELLKNRDGLMLGICNGFQALIKLGLVPYGEIVKTTADSPTLTHNLIGRHQSRYVMTRISSSLSPWLRLTNKGELHRIPVSHGEGRFTLREDVFEGLVKNGQIATQYCDENGLPSMDIGINPNGSYMAVEGITSPDGRVLGKMAHSERRGEYVGQNIFGNKHQPIFESGVSYYL